MIHIGALVGAGLSQFKSDSIGINIGEFKFCINGLMKYFFVDLS